MAEPGRRRRAAARAPARTVALLTLIIQHAGRGLPRRGAQAGRGEDRPTAPVRAPDRGVGAAWPFGVMMASPRCRPAQRARPAGRARPARRPDRRSAASRRDDLQAQIGTSEVAEPLQTSATSPGLDQRRQPQPRSSRLAGPRRRGAVTGPRACRITADSAPGSETRQTVLDTDLPLLVNALWAAGAEAIASTGSG